MAARVGCLLACLTLLGSGVLSAQAPPLSVRLERARAALRRGEALEARSRGAAGAERESLLVQALQAYAGAYRELRPLRRGERYPPAAEGLVRQVLARIALLRKVLPPERSAGLLGDLDGEAAPGPKGALEAAEAYHREAPRDYIGAYMRYQQVLDAYPESPAAILALRRMAELGWAEIREASLRRAFRRALRRWCAHFREGRYGTIAQALAQWTGDPRRRRVLRNRDWQWHGTLSRALRVFARARAALTPGVAVRMRLRSGRAAAGVVAAVDGSGVRLRGGERIPWAALAPETLLALAYPEVKTASAHLTAACFLALAGKLEAARRHLQAARRAGALVDDYTGPLARLLTPPKDRP